MPRKQKRFKSEQAILKAIDAMEARKQIRLEEADKIESSMRALHVEEFQNREEFIAELDYRRKMAGGARRSAQRAENKKVELGKALARFRTMLLSLPGNEDTSVVLWTRN